MVFASGYYKISYAQDLAIVQTRWRWAGSGLLLLGLAGLPFFASAFVLDLASQVFLALIGAIALMLLTGVAGQISLGHAGLLAAGAFTSAILYKEAGAPIWITLPASGAMGALLGLIFGLPSLRLKGLYLALSTLALHFIVTYLGSEYEARRGLSTGIIMDPPQFGPWVLDEPVAWYFVLMAAGLLTLLVGMNLMRSGTGRAWMALRDRDVAAAALGIEVARYKLLAFVACSVLTAMAGSLFAYYHGFVSVEAFSLLMTIKYIAMVIIGGLGTMLGAVLGTLFVVLLPHIIDEAADLLAVPERLSTYMFAVKQGFFGLLMILFLVLEPDGLAGIWRRVRDYLMLWPFRQRPVGG